MGCLQNLHRSSSLCQFSYSDDRFPLDISLHLKNHLRKFTKTFKTYIFAKNGVKQHIELWQKQQQQHVINISAMKANTVFRDTQNYRIPDKKLGNHELNLIIQG